MKPLLTVKDVCAILKVSKNTVYDLVREHRLVSTPIVYASGKIRHRFSEEAVQAYLHTPPPGQNEPARRTRRTTPITTLAELLRARRAGSLASRG